MARRETFGSISRTSNYGSGGEDGPKFIRCVGGREPQIHEVWNFGEDDVMREVHLTARVDVGAGFVGLFSTSYLTSSLLRVPMFGIWLGVADFLSTDGPTWIANFLAPHPS